MRFAAPTEKYPERCTNRDINLCQWWTPTWLAEAMVRLGRIPKGAYVLEPAAGNGAIVRALKAAGCEVEAHEIDSYWLPALEEADADHINMGDYLALPLTPNAYDWCVQNPPFDKRGTGDKFLIKTLEECSNVIALMRLNVIASGGRYEDLWRRFIPRLKAIHVLPNRPDFANGEPMFDGALSDFVVVIFDDYERPPEEWILHFLLPPPETETKQP